MVLFPDDGKFGLSNSGFEDDGDDDDKKESLCVTSVRKQKMSVTFDPSGLLEMLLMNGTERQRLNPHREIIIPQGIVQSDVLSCFKTH